MIAPSNPLKSVESDWENMAKVFIGFQAFITLFLLVSMLLRLYIINSDLIRTIISFVHELGFLPMLIFLAGNLVLCAYQFFRALITRRQHITLSIFTVTNLAIIFVPVVLDFYPG